MWRHPDALPATVQRFCAEAVTHGFFAVCVNPVFVAGVSRALDGTGVKACSVVGFPLGAAVSEMKAAETTRACRDGARKIDMVIAICTLKGGRRDAVRRAREPRSR